MDGRTRLACWLPVSLLIAAGAVRASKFGVPDALADPPGYFVLTGPQIPTGLGNLSFGDQRHFMEIFIEVGDADVRVDLFDPGLVGASGAGLDAFFNGVIGTCTYTLFDGTGAVLATRTFGSDDVTSDRMLVTLYDGVTAPGLHRLEVRMDDTASNDEDINAFGVSAPGHDMYAYWLTGGEVTLAGGTITQPVVTWPWVVHSDPDVLLGEPLTGIDVSTWDMDSAAAPPAIRIETPSGRGADLQPSPDSGLFTTNLRGLDRGYADCSDYGIYRFAFDQIDARGEGPNDLQIFTAQIYDYAAGVLPADFPLLPGDPRRPMRLYFPRDDGSAPLKESLVHTWRVASGPSPPAPGVPSQIEVSLEIRNPTAADLTAIDLVSVVATSFDLGPPVITSASPTLSPVVIGNEVRATGTVPAGTNGLVTYEVTFTPTGLAPLYLTGDGTDLQGGALPTLSTHDTGFETGVQLGPICMLRINAETPTCTATAIVDGILDICQGEDVVLGSAGSFLTGCPGALERRWLREGVEIAPYPAPVTLTDQPAVDTRYDLEVRCDVSPSCVDASAVIVRVEPDVPPPGVGQDLRVDKEPGLYRFTWGDVGAERYHLRQRSDLPFDRPTTTLVADVALPEHVMIAMPPAPYRIDHYQVFSANCAGTEEP